MAAIHLVDDKGQRYGVKQVDNKPCVISNLADSEGSLFTVQNPLTVDGDSVYYKDIAIEYCTKTGWTGDISSLFGCPNDSEEIYNSSSTNPKVLYIAFCRTLYLNAIGIGCNSGKTFSNLKIEFIGSDGSVRATHDDSANNTKYGTRLYDGFPPYACVAIKFSFCTADTVGLTNITIRKESSVVATIKGIDEDTGAAAYIKTSGGDFNVLARLRNATGNTKVNPATSDIQTDGSQITKIKGATGDSTYQVPRIDSVTHTLQTIDFQHHEIHAGSHFFYTDKVTLASAATQDYLITTPNTTKWAHFVFLATGSAITQVDLYEASDKNGTTPQTVYNSDRNSATTATTTIHKGTSGGTTDGTLIWTRKSGASAGASRTGMEATHQGEKILKQGTKYILRITSGTADNLTNVQIDWYEHINKTA